MKKINIKILTLFFIFTFILAITSTACIKFIVNNWLEKDLNAKIFRINKDLIYKEGKWDISRYNNDEILTGSYPLYIILNDGFVVDRRTPVGGFLDTTDFKRLLEYSSPTNVSTVTNQNKRVLSRLIGADNDFKGIVVVSYYNPDQSLIDKVDAKLLKNIDYISSSIRVSNDKIDVSGIDPAKIDYDIAFSVIDKFNSLVKRSNNVNSLRRNPSYIDPSYVNLALKEGASKIIRDDRAGERFYFRIQPLLVNKEIKGVIAVGTSVTLSEKIQLYNFFVILFFGTVMSLILSIIYSKFEIDTNTKKSYINMPKSISFDSKKSQLLIDTTVIEIPFATNQYYFLQAIFSNPTKRWEIDELLEKFGEHESSANWRKVYDTMIGINKKVEHVIPGRLVINKNKTYQLNPQLLPPKS